MSQPRWGAALALAAVTVLLLVGCGKATTHSASQAVAPRSSAPTPSDTGAGSTGSNAADSGSATQTLDVTTKDGYQYELDYSLGYSQPTTDPSTATPGNTNVMVNFSPSFTLKNTTPGGHELTVGFLGNPGLYVEQLFAAGSPVCSFLQHEGACSLDLISGGANTTVIPPGASKDISLTIGRGGGGSSPVVLANVPEASAASVIQSLQSSQTFLIGAANGHGNQNPLPTGCDSDNSSYFFGSGHSDIIAVPDGWTCDQVGTALANNPDE